MSTTRKARFGELCNLAMVELEPVGAADRRRGRRRAGRSQRALSVEDSGMGDMLRFDAERLRILVERHLLHTGSARAPRAARRLGRRRCTQLRQGDADATTAARCCELDAERAAAKAVAAE